MNNAVALAPNDEASRWRLLAAGLRELARAPAFVIGTGILLCWAIVAVAWPQLVSHSPFATGAGPALAPPNATFWLGTDDLGRDVLARVLAGAGDIFSVAPLATALTVIVGTVVGLVAAYARVLVDSALMRLVDLMLVFPPLLVAILVISALGSSAATVVLVVGLFGAPAVSRSIRGAAMVERDKEYVTAARMLGENAATILFREIMPNIGGVIVVEAAIRFSYAIFAIASLSFLGVGMQPPAADWGLSITSQRLYIQVQPWTVLGPTVALASLVIGVNLMVDRLRSLLVRP